MGPAEQSFWRGPVGDLECTRAVTSEPQPTYSPEQRWLQGLDGLQVLRCPLILDTLFPISSSSSPCGHCRSQIILPLCIADPVASLAKVPAGFLPDSLLTPKWLPGTPEFPG